jgi:ergothioneine biosynthesis protein EgtB
VAHVSYFEADAFARWAGKRLPTEFEWEVAAEGLPTTGNTLATRAMRPLPADGPGDGRHPRQMFGDVWEWTQSAYLPYPGYRPPEGALGEYNGKFMVSQHVLRGASCATPEGHTRATYRNFFYPHQRWQFMGLRLATEA